MNRRQSPETEAMRPPEQADKKIKLTEYFGIGNREQTQRKQAKRNHRHRELTGSGALLFAGQHAGMYFGMNSAHFPVP